jgi:hypothetical protein
MEIEEQKEHMNQMLDYLGRNSFTLKWGKENSFKYVVLTYTKKDSILRKEVTQYDYKGKVVNFSKKEKAMGGANGNDMYKAIKEAAKERAQKSVMRKLINQELEDNDVFL